MEPERKIEKWLRAYAKKRRGQAGPMNMHPATRRQLQSEIARTAPKPDDVNGSLSLWEMLRRRWAFLLACAVCVLIGATLLYLPLAASKNKAGQAVALASPEQISPAAQPSVADNSGNLPETLGDTNDLEPGAAPMPTYSLTPPGAVPPAPPAPTVAAASDEPVVVMAPPPPPPTEIRVQEEAIKARSQAQSSKLEQFAETQQAYAYNVRNVFQNAAGPSQASPILANFEVQQNGNAIRVVDRDGSVYEGSLVLATQKAVHESLSPQDQTQAAQNRLVQNSASVAAGLPSQSIALAQGSYKLAQNYFFRVQGTNRTTKQTIVFTGILLANGTMATNMTQALGDNNSDSGTVTPSGGGAGGGGGGGAVREKETTNQVAQLPWSSLRISGTAVVNRTNQIQINAAPVSPARN